MSGSISLGVGVVVLQGRARGFVDANVGVSKEHALAEGKVSVSIASRVIRSTATYDLFQRPVLGFGEEEVRDDRIGDVGDNVDQEVFPAQLVETTKKRKRSQIRIGAQVSLMLQLTWE